MSSQTIWYSGKNTSWHYSIIKVEIAVDMETSRKLTAPTGLSSEDWWFQYQQNFDQNIARLTAGGKSPIAVTHGYDEAEDFLAGKLVSL